MEDSILKSTKKMVGLAETYTAFDLDIITHINSVFSTLTQLGVVSSDGYMIEDDAANWADLSLPTDQLSMARTYMYLKVRQLFDPPTTSFALDALQKQIQELEYRLSYAREGLIPIPVVVVDPIEELI